MESSMILKLIFLFFFIFLIYSFFQSTGLFHIVIRNKYNPKDFLVIDKFFYSEKQAHDFANLLTLEKWQNYLDELDGTFMNKDVFVCTLSNDDNSMFNYISEIKICEEWKIKWKKK
jgi:hypothetical protein